LPPPSAPTQASRPVVDWQNEVNYAALCEIPEVVLQVERAAAQSSKPIEGKEYLKVFDEIFGVSISDLSTVVVPILDRMGMRTGKERSEGLPYPAGRVLVGVLCSLARHAQTLEQVQQFDDGCLLLAKLPSDIWTWGGSIVAVVHQLGRGRSQLEAATLVKGQTYDWGKSKRVLQTIFAEVHAACS
jgi:hypothetical protein